MRLRLTIGWMLGLIALAAANLGLVRYLYVAEGPHTRGFWTAVVGFVVALNLGAVPILLRSRPEGGPWPKARLRQFRTILVTLLLGAAVLCLWMALSR